MSFLRPRDKSHAVIKAAATRSKPRRFLRMAVPALIVAATAILLVRPSLSVSGQTAACSSQPESRIESPRLSADAAPVQRATASDTLEIRAEAFGLPLMQDEIAEITQCVEIIG